MPRLIISALLLTAMLSWGARWWVVTGEMKDELAKEITLTQAQMVACPAPLQLKVGAVHRAGFPWHSQLELANVELVVVEPNGQSLTYQTDRMRLTRAMAALSFGNGPMKALGGDVKDAQGQESAPAWSLVAPTHFLNKESGSHAEYDVALFGGDIAALVLQSGSPGVTTEKRPIRVRFPAELTLQAKSLVTGGDAASTGSRRFQFPAIPSGWLEHRLCDTDRAMALYGLIQSAAAAQPAKAP